LPVNTEKVKASSPRYSKRTRHANGTQNNTWKQPANA
jgi:hypothetical protein